MTSYSNSANLKEKEQAVRYDEFCYNGLHPQTQLEMTKAGNKSSEQIIKSIQEMENKLN